MYDVEYPMNRFDRVIPNLWIGGHIVRGPLGGERAVEVRREDEFDHVISLYIDRHSRLPESVRIHTIAPIFDGRYPSDREIAIIERLADEAQLSLSLDWIVLIRCQAGYNRSGVVAARVLMRLGRTADEAIAAVREARGKDALCNLHFVQYLKTRQREKDELAAQIEQGYEQLGAKVDEAIAAFERGEGVRRQRPRPRRKIIDTPPIENLPGQMSIEDYKREEEDV